MHFEMYMDIGQNLTDLCFLNLCHLVDLPSWTFYTCMHVSSALDLSLWRPDISCDMLWKHHRIELVNIRIYFFLLRRQVRNEKLIVDVKCSRCCTVSAFALCSKIRGLQIWHSRRLSSDMHSACESSRCVRAEDSWSWWTICIMTPSRLTMTGQEPWHSFTLPVIIYFGPWDWFPSCVVSSRSLCPFLANTFTTSLLSQWP